MSIEMFLAGFLFLFIIVTLIISSQFGNTVNFSDKNLDLDAKLQGITENPKKFRISVYFALADLGRSIIETKDSRFAYAQILFSIGTLAYAIVFVIFGAVPAIIGWFGLVAAIIYGLGNCITVAKPKVKTIAGLGGLLIFLFEAALGIWLIYTSLFIL